MEIGAKLKTARKNAGMTQAQLAEILEVRQKDISRWESGEYTPNLVTFANICKELKVSSDELLEIQ